MKTPLFPIISSSLACALVVVRSRRFPHSLHAIFMSFVVVLFSCAAGAQTKVVLLGTGTPRPFPDRSGPATAIVIGDRFLKLRRNPLRRVYIELPRDGDHGRAPEARGGDAEVEQLHGRDLTDRSLKVRPELY